MASLAPFLNAGAAAATPQIANHGAVFAAGFFGRPLVENAYTNFTNFCSNYGGNDQLKLNQMTHLYSTIISGQLLNTSRKISFTATICPATINAKWTSTLVKERLNEICECQKGCRRNRLVDEKYPAPENIFLEEMKEWIVRFTQQGNFNEEAKTEIEKRVEYITSTARLDGITWSGEFVGFLEGKLFDFLKILKKTITKEIKRNSLRIILEKINTLGIAIIMNCIHIIYDLTGLNGLNVKNLTLDGLLDRHETLKENDWGKLILSIITTATLQELISTTNQDGVQFSGSLEARQQNFYNQILSMLDFFLLCKTYKDFGDTGGIVHLKNKINEKSVRDDITFVFDNLKQIGKEIQIEVQEKINSGKARRCRCPIRLNSNAALKLRNNLKIETDLLETNLEACLTALGEMSTEALTDSNDRSYLKNDNETILRYANDLHTRVQAARIQSMRTEDVMMATVTFTDSILPGQKGPDSASEGVGTAESLAEESDTPDESPSPEQKLTEKVITPENNSTKKRKRAASQKSDGDNDNVPSQSKPSSKRAKQK